MSVAPQPPAVAPFSVLAIEDSAADARLLKESLRVALERGELVLKTVRSIGAAEEELRQHRHDCALLDLGLPDGQGLANVERLRSVAPQLAVIVLTGLDCESSAIRALQLGAQEYVVKGQYEGERLLKVVRHALERNRQVHELEERSARQFEQASHDPVTGLINRKLFDERARQHLAAAAGRRFGICFLDLDRFKAVNDRHGHAIGDALLLRIAQILRESVRDSDTLARIGGDEFAILLASIGELARAREVGERIVERIRAIDAIEGRPVAVGCSIGIALYPEHGETLEELLHHSDAAMYRAKHGGGGVLSLRDDFGGSDGDLAAEFATDAARAVVSGGFEIHFQPWLHYGTGEVAGVESLLRWRRPEGLLLPAEFLPLLERGGRMPEIGLQLARLAAREWRQWQDAGLAPGLLGLNLSGAELVAEQQPERLRAALAEEGLSPGQVQLEVDATAVGSADGRLSVPVERFREAGFTMVLEGFLPGNGDLHALASPAIGGVKLDRRLLRTASRDGRGSTSHRFLLGLLGAASALQLQVFLTGIESGEELEGFAGLDFRYVQGYWPCPPLARDELAAYLRGAAGRRRPAIAETVPE
ncbi:GGDEF domain-containing response regulator [Solimonas sp. K1W22B-7]|uniref:putative bifunctional diguanylate cyclase/phosphodiesterase n=1 Tax=Solimonas sp. K1W22B-7 TaxID=2303331 RepID=UPI000E32F728|nr:diguanylate cyclase [Solimonas sp. K1W22B-7]AXQ29044.1 GGDEF domain-containing response regulator [Solimonas sp. K1W22B-7]